MQKNIYSEEDSVKDPTFYYYLKMLDLLNESNLLVLSPVHHYYYDINELKTVRTLVHTKELNNIGNLKRFINNTVHVLSSNSKFIGCFIDNHVHKRFIYRNKILYWVNNCLSTQVHRYLSRKQIVKMFKSYGFDIVDISEINGISYFCVKKI